MSLHCQDEREGSLPTTNDLHTSYSSKGLNLYLKPFSDRRHPKSQNSSPKTWADLLLRVESRLPCTQNRTLFCRWETHPIPVFFFQLWTQSVSPQRTYHCWCVLPRHGICLKNWNITLILVLGQIKELNKLHTFPKSCLKSSQAHSSFS